VSIGLLTGGGGAEGVMLKNILENWSWGRGRRRWRWQGRGRWFYWIRFGVLVFFLLIFAIFATIAFSIPNIDDNFTSQLSTTRTYKNHTEKFTDTIYEWFTGKERRIESTHNNSRFSIYQFATNHTQYITVVGQCSRHAFNEPWFPYFDWLKESTQNGTCTVGTRTGTKWTDETKDRTLTLCASSNTPISIELDDRRNGFHDTVVFVTFHAGTPAASSFQTPSDCWNR